jgi:hypothetical protein
MERVSTPGKLEIAIERGPMLKRLHKMMKDDPRCPSADLPMDVAHPGYTINGVRFVVTGGDLTIYRHENFEDDVLRICSLMRTEGTPFDEIFCKKDPRWTRVPDLFLEWCLSLICPGDEVMSCGWVPLVPRQLGKPFNGVYDPSFNRRFYYGKGVGIGHLERRHDAVIESWKRILEIWRDTFFLGKVDDNHLVVSMHVLTMNGGDYSFHFVGIGHDLVELIPTPPETPIGELVRMCYDKSHHLYKTRVAHDRLWFEGQLIRVDDVFDQKRLLDLESTEIWIDNVRTFTMELLNEAIRCKLVALTSG